MKLSMKVEGGKLVNADIVLEGSVIRNIMLHGDFFIHPEESVEYLESLLEGCDICSIDFRKIESSLERQGIVLIGFSVADLKKLMRDACARL